MKNGLILIVDDDEAICQTMKEFVEMSGYQACTAYSAEEALQTMEDKPIRVVITDIILPGMDGLKLTAILRNKFDTDVIVMTGYSEDYAYEDAINEGASDFIFKPVRLEELLLRLKRVLRERQLADDRQAMIEKLKHLAITDGLTGLYNSRYFYEKLKDEIARCDRYGHPLSVLLLDIDLFKRYNDSYGHLEGDKVLARIGEIVKSCLREIDTAYRYGGEEFTVLLPETDGEDAHNVAERIGERVESEIFLPIPDRPVSLTVSIGVTQYCTDETVTDFIQRADKAMYASKDGGRNRVSCLFV